MKKIDKEKKRFEDWVNKEACWCLDWNGNDPYDHGLTMEAWDVWQGVLKQFTLKTWFLRKIEAFIAKISSK